MTESTADMPAGTLTLDVDLLRRTLAHVEALANKSSGDRWEQEVWRIVHPCGTAMCFAGWTAKLSDATFVVDDSKHAIAGISQLGWDDLFDLVAVSFDHPLVEHGWGDRLTGMSNLTSARLAALATRGLTHGVDIQEYAAWRLGFDPNPFNELELFDADNTIADLRRIVAKLIDESASMS